MFIHEREVIRKHEHSYRLTKCLPAAYFLLGVYHLLLACFARVLHPFYTKVGTESQNFSTHSEHSGPVSVEWVAKPELPAPVCILLSYSS